MSSYEGDPKDRSRGESEGHARMVRGEKPSLSRDKKNVVIVGEAGVITKSKADDPKQAGTEQNEESLRQV